MVCPLEPVRSEWRRLWPHCFSETISAYSPLIFYHLCNQKSKYRNPAPFLFCYFLKFDNRDSQVDWCRESISKKLYSEYICYSDVARGRSWIIYILKLKPSREGFIYTVDLFPHSVVPCSEAFQNAEHTHLQSWTYMCSSFYGMTGIDDCILCV